MRPVDRWRGIKLISDNCPWSLEPQYSHILVIRALIQPDQMLDTASASVAGVMGLNEGGGMETYLALARA